MASNVIKANETLKGRIRTARLALRPETLDYSKMSVDDLLDYYVVGARRYLFVALLSALGKHSWPEEPLPKEVTDEICRTHPDNPELGYLLFMASIYMAALVQAELERRMVQQPEIGALLLYGGSTRGLPDWFRDQIASMGYDFPSEQEAWEEVEKAMNLKKLVSSYWHGDQLVSEKRDKNDKELSEVKVDAQAALWEGSSAWLNSLRIDFNGTMIRALKGKASPYVRTTAKRRLAKCAEEDQPEVTKEWHRELKKRPPMHRLAKKDLRVEINGEHRRRLLSLETPIETERGSYTLDDSIQDPDARSEHEIERIERRALMDMAKASLEGRQREVIDMMLQGKDDKKIAKSLGISEGAVRKARHDAANNMRKFMLK